MNVLDLMLHVLSFAAPALAVALMIATLGRWLLPKGVDRPGWLGLFALNLVAGLAVLGAGLWYFGRDGKMATYGALVLVVATCQWLAGRGWRG